MPSSLSSEKHGVDISQSLLYQWLINHKSIKMKKKSWIIFGVIFIIISALYLMNKNTNQDGSESKPDVYMDEHYDQDND